MLDAGNAQYDRMRFQSDTAKMKNLPNVALHPNNPERKAFPAVQGAATCASNLKETVASQQRTIDKLIDVLRWYSGVEMHGGRGLLHRDRLEEDGGKYARHVLKELGYD